MSGAPAVSLKHRPVLADAWLSASRAVAGLSWWTVVLAAVLVYEAASFHTLARDNVAALYPINEDQTQYLTESYQAYDALAQRGLGGVLDVLRQRRAQGTLVQDFTGFVFLFTGPNRLTAIDVNIAVFLVYLTATAVAAKQLGGTPTALASVGLLTAESTILSNMGGVFDFRLDFAAMCLWGTFLTLAVLAMPGRGASGRGLLIAMSVLAPLLVLTRIITLAYLFCLLGGLTVLSALLRRRTSETVAAYRALLLVLCVCVAVAAVYAALNWDTLTAYYIGGHITSDEKRIRAVEVGISDLTDSVLFYLKSLVNEHMGTTFIRLGWLAVFASAAVVLGCGGLRGLRSTLATKIAPAAWVLSALVLGFVGPYVALTADEAKSPVVGDVLLPPVLLSMVVGFAFVSRLAFTTQRWAESTLLVVSVAVFVLGLASQLREYSRTLYATHHDDIASASQMMEDIGDYMLGVKGGQAVWTVDGHLDYTDPRVAETYLYEKRHVWLSVNCLVGLGPIQSTLTEGEVLSAARASDVVIITRGGQWIYPYDQSIEAAKPALSALAAHEFSLLREYRVYDRIVDVYVRL